MYNQRKLIKNLQKDGRSEALL